MKKLIILCALCCILNYYQQLNAQNQIYLKPTNSTETIPQNNKNATSVANKAEKLRITVDSLEGFNEAEIRAYLNAQNIQEPEYQNYIKIAKRCFINDKYHLTKYTPSLSPFNNNDIPSGNALNQLNGGGKSFGSALLNAAACVNEDFESTSPGFYSSTISGWSIDWMIFGNNTNGSTCNAGWGWLTGASKFQIRSTPISNPLPEISSLFVPALSSIPNSPLGGNNIAQLGDFDPSTAPAGSGALRTRIRKSFIVTSSNQYFQFSFIGAWENPGHNCCANPSFLANFYDCSGNLLPCGTFNFEPGGCANTGANIQTCNTFCYSWQPWNHGKIAYTPNWETRFVNLSQLIGQCVTVEFISNSCSAGGHVGAVFLDCQCSGSIPSSGQQLVGGTSQIFASPSAHTLCVGQQVTLNVSGASLYNWYKPPGGTQGFMGNGSQQTVAPGVTTTYTITGTTGLCSSVIPATIKVSVYAAPNVGIMASPNPLCLGNSIKLQGTGAHTYQWLNLPPPNTNSSVQVTPLITTSYSLIGKSSITGCSKQTIITITVVPQPTITTLTNPLAICPGGNITLTASGANTYTWNPGTFIGNSYQIAPGGTTTYTVTGSNAVNCTGSTTVQAVVLHNPTVSVAPSSICSGIINTLTASGAINYTFYIGGTNPATLTSPIVTLNLTSATPYTLCGAVPGTATCAACISGAIPIGTVIPISAPDLTLCTNGGSCTALTASTSASQVNFNWQPINQNGATISVCPTVNTTYSVFATSTATGTCPNSSTVSLTYSNNNCCPHPPASLIPLNNISGNYQNSSYLLDNSQTLSGNTNFINSEVWITQGVQLTIPTGTVMDLESTHFFACGINMWQGIKVLDGGRITTSNIRQGNSMIEDAEVAIELDGINSANIVPGQPAIDVHRVIFNKNFIAIKISNSDANLDSLALGITGCVFASRDMSFTTAPNALSWPSADMALNSNGLRLASSPTTGLVPPYNLNLFKQANLKLPHSTHGGHIGIKIENIGKPASHVPKPGVQFGITYLSSINPEFNLFDGLGHGIDITDASLTTVNNVFQNSQQYYFPVTSTVVFGGVGLHHVITDIRNARLSLKDINKNASTGNQFWDCHKGVVANNVFNCWTRYAIFRSTHNRWTTNPFFQLGNTQGDIGIEFNSNRFEFTVVESQFNNVRHGINFSTPVIAQPYDITGINQQTGIFAKAIIIERNYFGPEVLSTNPIPVEYMSDAIVIQTPNTTGWQNNTQFSFISSNKFNRVYRGVHINGLHDHPFYIVGNEFLIDDDYVYGPPDKGWGVKVENNMNNMTMMTNTLQSMGSTFNTSVSLVYCENNYGIFSPWIRCNRVSDSKFGFEFSALNQNAVWQGNDMCNLFGGLALTNSAVIGSQGGSSGGNGNWWSNSCVWSTLPPFPKFQTYCDNSDPALSQLYVFSPSPTYEPIVHGSFPVSNPLYANGITVLPVTSNVTQDCTIQNPFLPVPNWRIIPNSGSGITEMENQSLIQLYPNPTKGVLILNGPNKEANYILNVKDLTGKVVIEGLTVSADNGEIDLSLLPASIYFVDIISLNMMITHKKVIKIN